MSSQLPLLFIFPPIGSSEVEGTSVLGEFRLFLMISVETSPSPVYSLSCI